MKIRHFIPLLAVAGCAAGVGPDPSASDPSSTETVGTSESALFVDPGPIMHVVAHEDDDLPFMNLSQDLNHGDNLVAVYVTAGDAGYGETVGSPGTPNPCQTYFKGREDGMLAAYETALGVTHAAAAWGDDSFTVTLPSGGTKLIRRRVGISGKVTLLFMGLPNNPLNGGYEILDLWDGNTPNLITPIDSRRAHTDTYTREDLIAAIEKLYEMYKPGHISTIDSARIWPTSFPTDHPDHVGVSLAALAAKQRYTPVAPAPFPDLRIHRGYNQAAEDDNVSAADAATRHAIFAAYQVYDKVICPPGMPGIVDVCAGSPVSDYEFCDDPNTTYVPYDSIVYANLPLEGGSGELRGPGALCLQAASASAGAALSLGTCTAASTQQWDLRTVDNVRLHGTGLCAFANVTPRGRGMGLTLQACSATSSNQRFFQSTDTTFRGPDATCVQAGSNGTSLTIQECSGVDAQLDWTQQVSSSVTTATSSGVSDTEIPAQSAYYAALHLGDVNGDTAADLCERRTDGIWCAPGSGTSTPTFGTFVHWTTSFSDAAGWGGASAGSTVQLADVNHDGKADVCGRKSDGVYCAISNGSTFAAPVQVSTDFTDGQGYGTASTYSSLRVVDVNNDHAPDICSRNSNGIACALSKNLASTVTPAFNAVTQWDSAEFTDALGWTDVSGASTLNFADIDGDHLADVCGRGAMGIRCALNTGASHFNNEHQWSDTGDWSNAEGWNGNESYYRSIRLVDINGDGRADVCGRGIDGVTCSISTGAAFTTHRPFVTVYPYTDSDGWTPAKYGSTLMFADLNKDGRPDMCARGPIPGGGVGVRCALGPAPAN